MDFDLDALVGSSRRAAQAARSSSASSSSSAALPALLLYRGVLERRERVALAFFSATELPLVVAITTLAPRSGHMRISTSAALVGAAILSTLIYPFVGLALRRGADVGTPADLQPVKR